MKSFTAEVNVESLVKIVKGNEEVLDSPRLLGENASYNDTCPLVTGFEIELASREIKRNAIRRLSSSLKDKADEFAGSENLDAAGVFGRLGIKLDKAASSVARVASDGLDKISACSESRESSVLEEMSSTDSQPCCFYNTMRISLIYGKRARHRNELAVRGTIRSLEVIDDAEIKGLSSSLSEAVRKINENLEIDVVTFGSDEVLYQIYEKDPEFTGEKIKMALHQAIDAAENIAKNEGNYNLYITVTKRLNCVQCKIEDIKDCEYEPDMAGFNTHYISMLAYGDDFKVVAIEGFVGNCCTQVYVAPNGTIFNMPVPYITEHYNIDYLVQHSGKFIGLNTGAMVFDINKYSNVITPITNTSSNDNLEESVFSNAIGVCDSKANSYSSQIDILVLPQPKMKARVEL